MANNFDLNKLPENGYLVFPLSMSRLQKGQNPDKIYTDLHFFNKKISKISLDVIFLYTNGLYMNSEETALKVREKTLNQIINHKNRLWNLILKKREFVPQAFHFETWDHLLANAEKFQEVFAKLKKLYPEDKEFQKILEEDLGEREKSEANLNFLLEEIVITHLLRQKLIPLPHTLTPVDGWRLIVYPGTYLKADAYAYQKRILCQNKEIKKNEIFSHAHYDLQEKKLIDLEKD
ncbi:MAG: hypothetical protein AABX04_01850 [Nanoarchaeota archaeon]